MPSTLRALLVLLLAAIWFAPLAHGATSTWSQSTLETLLAITVLIWSCSCRTTSRLVYLPLGILILGLCQLIPLPDSLTAVVSPLAHAANEALAPLGLERAVSCVSVCPGATLADLRLLLLLAATAVVVADLSREKRTGTICAKHPVGRSGKWSHSRMALPLAAQGFTLPGRWLVSAGRGHEPEDS